MYGSPSERQLKGISLLIASLHRAAITMTGGPSAALGAVHQVRILAAWERAVATTAADLSVTPPS